MTSADVQRRTIRVLVLSQVLGGVGLAAGVAVGALLAADLLEGGTALTGVPQAAATAGGALAAVPLSHLMARAGRRRGLTAGYLLGGSGAAVVVVSAQVRSVALLVAGMALFGAGNAAGLLARYAAADLAEPQRRGRAVSTVLFATTLGAVAGPNLVEPAGALAAAMSLPRLAGPFLLSLAAYGVAAAVVQGLRPDPLLVARASVEPVPATPGPAAWALVLRGPALGGLAAMVGAQFVMVAMMTMTPVHMVAHGHDLGVIGFVIGVHIAGMYAFAPLGGLLADLFGPRVAARAGAVALTAAGLGGALAPPSSVLVLATALFLLGIGWSLALVGGSALLTASVPAAERAGAQGRGDLLVGLAGAVGGLGSGLVLALSGFAVLGLLTAAVATAVLATGSTRGGRSAAPVTAGPAPSAPRGTRDPGS